MQPGQALSDRENSQVSMTQPSREPAEPFYNPHVAALPKYNSGVTVAVARAASGLAQIARLGSNENPYGCSPAVLEALATGGVEIARYSDPGCEALRAALGTHLQVDPADIVVGNGSEEMIAAAARAFLTDGATALTVAPAFGLHEIEPLAVGARVVKVPMTAACGFDVAGIEAALAGEPNLFFLPSPWNPVGAALDAGELERVIRATSPGTMFVLDEAYREFTSDAIPDGLLALRRAGVPHIVLRTFSKAFGLAGLRVGYAVCSSARIARMLSVAKTPFNVNAMAQAAAVAALGDQAWMRASTLRIRAERERVRAALVALGLDVAPSEGNFLFFDTRRNSGEVATELLRRGVIVKPWNEPKYATFVRASIGSETENDLFLAALAAVLESVRYPGMAAVR
jgi:histidinol-phosphate aminotransferase